MQIGTVRVEETRVKDSRAGYHEFERLCYQCFGEDSESCDVCEGEGVNRSGSFEVFWDDADTGPYSDEPRNFDSEGDPVAPRWYWWPCFPGCLPDGDPIGPFASSIAAYYDAMDY